ncbi:hypothetical protein SK128_024545 [Halocaridina rubra]|uniref:Uncharacterized protein n=1 Tax=Halocaridina rubra TaxID=373956 RepID=A0AAN8X4M1_HALRR
MAIMEIHSESQKSFSAFELLCSNSVAELLSNIVFAQTSSYPVTTVSRIKGLLAAFAFTVDGKIVSAGTVHDQCQPLDNAIILSSFQEEELLIRALVHCHPVDDNVTSVPVLCELRPINMRT